MRYFVDERVGCVAVRDRRFMAASGEPGLHPVSSGVVQYWHGVAVSSKCPTCGQHIGSVWTVNDDDRKAAHVLCDELNAAALAAAESEKEQ